MKIFPEILIPGIFNESYYFISGIFLVESLVSVSRRLYKNGSILSLYCTLCRNSILEIFTYQTHIQGYGILTKNSIINPEYCFCESSDIHIRYITPYFSLHFNTFVVAIINTGHLSSSTIGLYNIFSIHHIFASEIAIVTGYNPLPVYLLSGSFILALGVLFVFLLGKRFVNFQFGLVASMLFTCLDYYLMYGEHPEHQAYNYGFALICFTLILFTYRFQKPAFYVLFAFSAVTMVLTHHLTAAFVFVTVCSLLIIDVCRSVQKRKFSLPSVIILIVLILLLFGALTAVSSNDPVQYVSQVLKPYFMSTYSLLTNFFVTPVPVTLYGHSCTGHSCTGHSCTGHSCTGHSCTGHSCTGHSALCSTNRIR